MGAFCSGSHAAQFLGLCPQLLQPPALPPSSASEICPVASSVVFFQTLLQLCQFSAPSKTSCKEQSRGNLSFGRAGEEQRREEQLGGDPGGRGEEMKDRHRKTGRFRITWGASYNRSGAGQNSTRSICCLPDPRRCGHKNKWDVVLACRVQCGRQ